ncbi:hypothetical protein [Desulfococcus sp.]|uniref:hypothetical protein n=1 Tax=Desulfococcus sp. TaxID=2025834 RepID=UPI00359346BC
MTSENNIHFQRINDLKAIPICFHVILALGLIIAVSAVYSNTVKSPFLLDGYGNIVGNSAIEIKDLSWESLKQAWSGPHIVNNRKLAYLTFALNYLLGGYDPLGYHLVNIGIHICSALLLFLFFCQILDTGWLRTRYGGRRHQLAWGAAFIWALHPIQINAVTYLVQRMTSLAFLFALLAMIAWMAGRRRWEAQDRMQASVCWLLGIIAWILGLLSKEHVAIVPMLILVQDFFLFRRGLFYQLKWYWGALAILVAAMLVFFYMGPDPIKRVLSGYARRDFTLTERLLTESRVLWHYISLFLFPVSDRFSIFYEYPVSSGLFSPMTTFLSISAWIGAVVSAWLCRSRFPVFAWMTAWYVAGHLIESTVVPLEIIFEHRMYLPSVGLVFGAVLMLSDVIHQQAVRPSLRWIILSAFFVILGCSTYIRNMDFKDEITLYRAELKKHPDSNRNQLGLALALTNAGRFAEGGSMLKGMAEALPHDFVVQQNWHAFLVQVKKDTVLSEQVYENMIKILDEGHYNPRNDANALKCLAELFFEKRDYERTLLLVDRLLLNYPYASLFLLKEICHAKRHEWSLARQAGHEAMKRSPQDIEMIYWYSKSLIYLGEKVEGCGLLRKGVKAGGGDKNVRSLCQNLLDGHCRKMN